MNSNMEANGTPPYLNVTKADHSIPPPSQPTIRSFFQPRQPNYTAPPSLPVTKSDGSLPSNSITQTPPSAPQLPRYTTSTIPQQATPSTASQQASIPSKPFPQQATITLIKEEHIQPLRRINALLLPVNYPDSFYNKVLSPDNNLSFSRAIVWNSQNPSETKVIGGIICRLDPALSPSSTPQIPLYLDGFQDIYIQSLALLSPYRSKNLAATALQEIITTAVSQNEIKITSLYAHVWTENEEALTWYAARGFQREEPMIHGYYRRLKPDTAWIVRRRLVPTDHLNTLPLQVQEGTSEAKRPGMDTETKARSFQDKGPEREWNDLPEEVMLKPPSHLGSKEGSAASSRSSSRSGIDRREKKKRVYPAAAFGG